jgi:hypothetical protein
MMQAMVGSCHHDNELSGFTKLDEFIGQLSKYQLLTNGAGCLCWHHAVFSLRQNNFC